MFRDMPKAAAASVPSAKQLNIDQLANEINTISRRHLTPTSFDSIFAASEA